jgi:hypothetical protein
MGVGFATAFFITGFSTVSPPMLHSRSHAFSHGFTALFAGLRGLTVPVARAKASAP